MVKAYLRAAQKFLDTHADSKTVKTYGNVYEWFVRDVFFDSTQEWIEANNGMFGKPNYKELIEKTFNIKIR